MSYKSIVIAIMLMWVCASSAFATPDRTGKWDVGVSGNVGFSDDTDLNTGGSVVGSVSYGVNPWLGVGFSSGWVGYGTDDEDIASINVPGPDFSAIPLFGDIIFRVPATEENPAQFYGVIGLGVLLWEIDDVTTSNGILLESDVDTEFAAKLGLGLDWFFNDNWAVNFEGGYVFSEPATSVTASTGGISASVVDDVNLSYWYAGVGLKFVF